jgi:hypothetical protein
VETEDGYRIKIHRVKAKGKQPTRLGPALLMHGLGATSADFLLTGPEIALGN